jgi:hypothetical protein
LLTWRHIIDFCYHHVQLFTHNPLNIYSHCKKVPRRLLPPSRSLPSSPAGAILLDPSLPSIPALGEHELGSMPRLLPRREARARRHHVGGEGWVLGRSSNRFPTLSPQRRIRQLPKSRAPQLAGSGRCASIALKAALVSHLHRRAPSLRSHLAEEEACYCHVWTPRMAVRSWGGARRLARSAAGEERHAGRACWPALRYRKP